MIFLILFAGMLAAVYIAMRAAVRIETEGISALLFFAFVMLTITLAALGFEAFETKRNRNRKR